MTVSYNILYPQARRGSISDITIYMDDIMKLGLCYVTVHDIRIKKASQQASNCLLQSLSGCFTCSIRMPVIPFML